MSTLTSQSYLFDPRPNYPFLITAKRYWDPTSPSVSDPNALTLIFAHGTGFHKEQWEPTIDDLYALVGTGSKTIRIREVWSIDSPNHGDAAILNEETLQWGYHVTFGWEEYARSIHAFLSGLGTGVDVDFSTRRLVGIGHSMGAISLMLSTTYHPPIRYSSLQLIEPMTMSKSANKPNFLAEGAAKRRDIWPSREEAFNLFKSRPSWKVWDERVLKLYVEHGLRSLPTADYPDKSEGVTLKCSKNQEAACYRDPIGFSRAYNFLSTIVKRIPVHMIYGAVDDYVSGAVKDDVLNNGSGGIENFASVARVEGAGHLVVQTHPLRLAQKIYDALLHSSTTLDLRARL